MLRWKTDIVDSLVRVSSSTLTNKMNLRWTLNRLKYGPPCSWHRLTVACEKLLNMARNTLPGSNVCFCLGALSNHPGTSALPGLAY